MIEIGSKILFSLGNEKVKDNLGIVLDKKDKDYVILRIYRGGCSIYVRLEESIDDINNIEKVRQDIIDYYTPLIDEVKNKLRTVTSEEKMQERVIKYNDIKARVLTNCERIIVCTDDDEFENRLKEIHKLKKQIYSLDLECGDIIRKENAKVKYDIRQIQLRMNISLDNISDENIIKTFSFK